MPPFTRRQSPLVMLAKVGAEDGPALQPKKFGDDQPSPTLTRGPINRPAIPMPDDPRHTGSKAE